MQNIERGLDAIARAIVNNRGATLEQATLSLSANWSFISGHTGKVVKINGICYLTGILTKSAAWSANDVIATIPEGFRPNSQYIESYFIPTAYTNVGSALSGYMNIFSAAPATGTAGQIVARTAGSSTQHLGLYGISYPCE